MRQSKTKKTGFFEIKEFKDVVVKAQKTKGNKGKKDDFEFTVYVEIRRDKDIAEFKNGKENDKEDGDGNDDQESPTDRGTGFARVKAVKDRSSFVLEVESFLFLSLKFEFIEDVNKGDN